MNLCWCRLPQRLVLLSFFVLVGLGITFYVVLYEGLGTSVKGQALQKQKALVRAQTNNIESFFDIFGNSVVVLAKSPSVSRGDPEDIEYLIKFVDQWNNSNLVGGIILTDSEGIIIHNSSLLGTDNEVGVSLSDRGYFLWAKDQNEENNYYIGEPIVSRAGASKGMVIIPVASPVFRNGIFKGVLAASVILSNLTENYLELMKISDNVHLYLIDEKDRVIYSNVISSDGFKNISEVAEDYPTNDGQNLFGILNTILEKREVGGMGVSYTDPWSSKRVPHLVTYSPFVLGDHHWMLISSTEAVGGNDYITPIRVRVLVMLLLVSITTVLYGVFVAKEVKRN